MTATPITFVATGSLQSYIVPQTGYYLLEASGAQGGAGGGPGGKGARLRGTFYLEQYDVLHILVGKQGTPGDTPHEPAGGGGGGTFIWKSPLPTPLPKKPLLAAGGGGGGAGGDGLVCIDGGDGAAPGGRNGHGGESDLDNLHYSGGGGSGWLSGGDIGSTPTLCGGGTLWHGGAGAQYLHNTGGSGGFGGGGGGAFLGCGSGGGGGFSGGGGGTLAGPHAGGGGSYNAGAFQQNLPGIHVGHGCVTILAIPAPTGAPLPGQTPRSAHPFALASDDSGLATAEASRSENSLAGRGYM